MRWVKYQDMIELNQNTGEHTYEALEEDIAGHFRSGQIEG